MKTALKISFALAGFLALTGCAGTLNLPAGGVRVGVGLGASPFYSPPYGYGYRRGYGYGYGRGYGYRRGYW